MSQEKMRRFSVSFTPEMDERLEALKRDVYYADSYSHMVRDVIKAGLEVMDRAPLQAAGHVQEAL